MTKSAPEKPGKSRQGEVLPAHPPLLDGRVANLDSAGGVLKEMATVYRAARAGRLDVQTACRLTFILQSMGRLWEVVELERRVTALEGRTK